MLRRELGQRRRRMQPALSPSFLLHDAKPWQATLGSARTPGFQLSRAGRLRPQSRSPWGYGEIAAIRPNTKTPTSESNNHALLLSPRGVPEGRMKQRGCATLSLYRVRDRRENPLGRLFFLRRVLLGHFRSGDRRGHQHPARSTVDIDEAFAVHHRSDERLG